MKKLILLALLLSGCAGSADRELLSDMTGGAISDGCGDSNLSPASWQRCHPPAYDPSMAEAMYMTMLQNTYFVYVYPGY
jgi:hypothetical protein